MHSAFKIGQRVAMLHAGKVVFEGTVKEFQKSKNPLVHGFLEYQREAI
jgi:ABC-type transporter Mla maintaining outer membrane lipid asymmetry ATPase subunit MlaF